MSSDPGGQLDRSGLVGGLLLMPDKTTIVYCKDGNLRESYAHTSFTFLEYTFRAPRGP